MEGNRAKGQAGFRRNHSTTDHLVTLRIIAEEYRNKYDLFCCFVDFRKVFVTIPRNNMWNRLEELNVPFELRDSAIRLSEKLLPSLRIMRGGQHI